MIRNQDALAGILFVLLIVIIVALAVEDSQNVASYQQFVNNCGALCR